MPGFGGEPCRNGKVPFRKACMEERQEIGFGDSSQVVWLGTYHTNMTSISAQRCPCSCLPAWPSPSEWEGLPGRAPRPLTVFSLSAMNRIHAPTPPHTHYLGCTGGCFTMSVDVSLLYCYRPNNLMRLFITLNGCLKCRKSRWFRMLDGATPPGTQGLTCYCPA